MKMSILIALLLMSNLALARESTPVEDAWFKLQALAQLEPGERVRGVDIPDPVALQQYIEKSREQLHRLSRTFWDDLCVNRPEYESDHQKLIARWDLYVREKQSMKQSVIDGLPDVIGRENAEAFLSYVAATRRSKTIGFDDTDIRSDEAKRQQMLSRACERGEQHP